MLQMKKTSLILLLFICKAAFSQSSDAASDTAWKHIYRAEATKVNDLVHTKLDVKFDYSKSYMYGKEWLTLKPHFYATDSLTLDAKGMAIKEIAMMNGTSKSALKYDYDGNQLRIKLGYRFVNRQS